jgi:hypothetical protein
MSMLTRVPAQVVVGRTGEQGLTSESGDDTRCARALSTQFICINHIFRPRFLSQRYAPARSHLQGMFYRTAKMLEAGIKPVYAPRSHSRAARLCRHVSRGA